MIDEMTEIRPRQFMGNVAALPSDGNAPVVQRPITDPSTKALVKKLRVLLQNSLLKPRYELDHACILIAGDRHITTERYAAAFFHGLEGFARRKLRFFTPKSDAVSEDEMWLARLLQSFYSGDYTSARYLIALRIEPAGRRRLSFLAQGLAESLFAAARPAMVACADDHETD